MNLNPSSFALVSRVIMIVLALGSHVNKIVYFTVLSSIFIFCFYESFSEKILNFNLQFLSHSLFCNKVQIQVGNCCQGVRSCFTCSCQGHILVLLVVIIVLSLTRDPFLYSLKLPRVGSCITCRAPKVPFLYYL